MRKHIKRLISPSLIVIACLLAGKALASSASESVKGSMARLDAIYADTVPWILHLYDEETGGFYQAESLKDGTEDQPYEPDIQSTFQAVFFLDNCGQLSVLTEEQRAKIIQFFQVRQDPETGYFSDPFYPQMKDNPRVMGRALMFSLHALRILKAEPLYPLPGDKSRNTEGEPQANNSVDQLNSNGSDDAKEASQSSNRKTSKQANIPGFLESREAFQLWLNELPWDNSWKALDALSSQASLIQTLEPSTRDALIELALENVRDRQDPLTGLIGVGSYNVRISGSFKLIAFCNKLKQPIPRAKELRASALGWFNGDLETDQILFIFNATEMLSALVKETGEPLSDEEIVTVINVASRELEKYRSSDGAFHRRLSGYRISPNDLFWRTSNFPGQGGMNAVHAARGVRESLYKLAGMSPPPLKVVAQREEQFSQN
ncbi:hypothetical protein H5P28_00990 [Ruficoccus amylovorans]|uniref:Uncharacterized protein n=1 Tax=Ruficoccus amylovorans TaxID=1804625 RepID=A0A842HB17_9BACT|nr:hypothetical protein [Ruficoccus amylovorans]MBC2592827.1 hypothetical protein [Ruficoccus amylovorans]